MLHEEALTGEAKKFFPRLSQFKDTFYLAGGTAFALEIGHRVSVDFDLFSPNPIEKTLHGAIEEAYQDVPKELLVSTSRELTLLIDGVKHTFLHYPFPLLLPLEDNETIPLLSRKELLSTKAYTIGRRGTFKDYVDLYTGIRENVSDLSEIITLSQDKYTDAFNDRLFLEQLIYLDDLTEDPIIMLKRDTPTKNDIRNFFTHLISTMIV